MGYLLPSFPSFFPRKITWAFLIGPLAELFLASHREIGLIYDRCLTGR